MERIDWTRDDNSVWIPFNDCISKIDSFWMRIAYYGVIAYALFQVHQGWLTLGMMFPTIIWAQTMTRKVTDFGEVTYHLMRHRAYATALVEMLTSPMDVTETPDAVALKPLHTIRFENVCFAYHSTGQMVLRDINLTLRAGQMTAVVGETGSGKSTLIKLLLRSDDVNAGRIMANDTPITRVTLHSLRGQIAYVPQHPTPWETSIRSNLLFSFIGQVTPNDDALLQTLAECGLSLTSEHSKRFTDGLNTLVGEDGIWISGGEKQRLAIATAVVANRPFIIFDEPTSALDAKTEELITHIFRQLKQRGFGLLVVAHRWTTISGADQLCVMKPLHLCTDTEPQLGIYHSIEEAGAKNTYFKAMYDAHRNGMFIDSGSPTV